ncbi:MAG: 50S ribosomal protein L29 [Ignavibacteria bacterium]|nr:MAG: 50S ribosomal protein L29 [Ignavibacteria bacterium]
MKAMELRQMTTKEIRDRLVEDQENLSTLHFQLASSQLADTSQIQKLRRDIARMNTLLKERELSGEEK